MTSGGDAATKVLSPPVALGYAKSFGIGTAFSLGWTPCIGPILGAVFTLAADSGTVWKGTYLLAFYSAGLGVPFLLSGLALGTATAYMKKIRPIMPAATVVGGVLVIFVGVLIFVNRLTIFNQYFDFFGLSQI